MIENVILVGLKETASTSASVRMVQPVIILVGNASAPLDTEEFIVIFHVKRERGVTIVKKPVNVKMEDHVIMKLVNVGAWLYSRANFVKLFVRGGNME